MECAEKSPAPKGPRPAQAGTRCEARPRLRRPRARGGSGPPPAASAATRRARRTGALAAGHAPRAGHAPARRHRRRRQRRLIFVDYADIHFISALGLLSYTMWFALMLIIPSEQLVVSSSLKKFTTTLTKNQ